VRGRFGIALLPHLDAGYRLWSYHPDECRRLHPGVGQWQRVPIGALPSDRRGHTHDGELRRADARRESGVYAVTKYLRSREHLDATAGLDRLHYLYGLWSLRIGSRQVKVLCLSTTWGAITALLALRIAIGHLSPISRVAGVNSTA
jgi:hypothetical protein